MTKLPGDPAACARCGNRMELLQLISRLGEQPAYRIFGCVKCQAIEWVAVDHKSRPR